MRTVVDIWGFDGTRGPRRISGRSDRGRIEAPANPSSYRDETQALDRAWTAVTKDPHVAETDEQARSEAEGYSRRIPAARSRDGRKACCAAARRPSPA
jgi:alkanesulfonate monooxygenase SsuD/methylene tetrahydromethanopterin reductase-like flavin-dependent oxidoreductase (luciferase family)